MYSEEEHRDRLIACAQYLERQIQNMKRPTRDKIIAMSGQMSDTNPYSRLMALTKMGMVENFDRIRDFTVAIVGVGGIGSVTADMLTRCGIGRLLLFDKDKVEIANISNSFFEARQKEMLKVKAAVDILRATNPDVEMLAFDYDITAEENLEEFMNHLRTGSKKAGLVDILLSCVDNFEANSTINMVCSKLNLKWFSSITSENAMGGHVQFISPGETACFACINDSAGQVEVDEDKDRLCCASLPTTTTIIAGFLGKNTLKYLLGFGQVSNYLDYNALEDKISNVTLKPNPACENEYCRKWQEEVVNHLSNETCPANLEETAEEVENDPDVL